MKAPGQLRPERELIPGFSTGTRESRETERERGSLCRKAEGRDFVREEVSVREMAAAAAEGRSNARFFL